MSASVARRAVRTGAPTDKMTSHKKFETRVNIRQFEAFRALMIAGTAKAAARLLGISQPAVSKLIEQLEQNLKLALFRPFAGPAYADTRSELAV
jgi:DNA-binding MarR family transcriptional regulator